MLISWISMFICLSMCRHATSSRRICFNSSSTVLGLGSRRVLTSPWLWESAHWNDCHGTRLRSRMFWRLIWALLMRFLQNGFITIYFVQNWHCAPLKNLEWNAFWLHVSFWKYLWSFWINRKHFTLEVVGVCVRELKYLRIQACLLLVLLNQRLI